MTTLLQVYKAYYARGGKYVAVKKIDCFDRVLPALSLALLMYRLMRAWALAECIVVLRKHLSQCSPCMLHASCKT